MNIKAKSIQKEDERPMSRHMKYLKLLKHKNKIYVEAYNVLSFNTDVHLSFYTSHINEWTL